MNVGIHMTCLLFLSDFNHNRNGPTNLGKYSKNKTTKIPLLEFVLFHADRGKDGHDEANRRFSQPLFESS
jgi:hypothetical protein